MKTYEVRITATAASTIEQVASYIVHEQQTPGTAKNWLEAVWDAVDSLRTLPNRAPLAEEDAFVDYVDRRLGVFQHIVLFTVHEEHGVVYVIGVRHGHRRPRPDELPESQRDLVAEEE